MPKNIILYTTHCPLCRGLEKSLQSKSVPFTICTDKNTMSELGITKVPKLGVDGQILSHKEALVWLSKWSPNDN